MKNFISQNPATEKVIQEYSPHTPEEINSKIELAQNTFESWSKTTFESRAQLFQKLAKIILDEKNELAKLTTLEMGKPISASIAEIEKCAVVCTYYAENAEKFLADEVIPTEASLSKVVYESMGVIFAIMPWNFPFWQVFRFAAPALMAGNTALLKHASNVSGCSLAIEKLFITAGFPEGAFQSLLVASTDTESIITNPIIKAVTLTGSEKAGMTVASTAAKAIKKSVLELGGSDPFIVLKDADVELAATNAVTGRMVAGGQSCIAAKRFIVHESIAEKFTQLFKEKMEALKVGDPLDPTTQVGSLSSLQILETIDEQLQNSVKMGARVVTGGKRIGEVGFFYAPTVVDHVTEEMPVMKEEVFGPIAPVITFNTDEKAIQIANNTPYGLGASIWTKDIKHGEQLAGQIISGCVFINSIVKSDPRLPFGGTKLSGYGRELSLHGIREFVNVKTVYIA